MIQLFFNLTVMFSIFPPAKTSTIFFLNSIDQKQACNHLRKFHDKKKLIAQTKVYKL